MDDPAPSAIRDSPGTSFPDPALESAFGLDRDSDWIARARQAEAPRPTPAFLGNFQLLEEIGRGGQGVVYKAVQPGTGRPVALKCFPAVKPGKRDRFQHEVEALIRLDHPSVVTVHGAEVINGSPILLMEHIEGSPIDQWADGDPTGRRPRSQILAAFMLVCSALSHAHQRGVIHRDLKPSNVLVDQSGLPRVLDFGVARLADDLQSRGHWTVTGFVGTPAYSSPEQLEDAAAIDTRTDIYSLGALLYRILTGVEPFACISSLPAMINAVRSGAIQRPSAVCPTLPHELDWIVLRAMNTEPAQRYQTVDALAADIDRFLKDQPVTAHPPSTLYTLTKFARRHAVACSLVLSVTVLIASLAGVSIAQAFRLSRQNTDLTKAVAQANIASRAADAERVRANAQAGSQREVLQTTADIIERIAARANRVANMNSTDVFGIIDPALARLAEPQHPEAGVQFHTLRARVALAAHRYEESLAHWTRAIEAANQLDKPDPATLAAVYQGRGAILTRMRRYDEAKADIDRALESADPLTEFRVRGMIMQNERESGDFERARATGHRMIQIAGENAQLRAGALDALSEVEQADQRSDAAARHMADAVASLKAAGLGGSLDAARHRVRLAHLFLLIGNASDAETVASEAVAIRLQRCGAMHIRTQQAVVVQAEALFQLGRFSDAAASLEVIRPRIESIHGKASQQLARHRLKLAAAYLGAGDRTQFRRNLALAVSQGVFEDPSQTAIAAHIATWETAITANSFRIDQKLATPLRGLAWLIEGASPAVESETAISPEPDPGTVPAAGN